MVEFSCRFAAPDGRVLERIESAESEDALRQRFGDRGLLLYSVKQRHSRHFKTLQWQSSRLNLGQFLIFNRQFVTLTRAGLPILKSLEILASNMKNRRLGDHLDAIHREVKTGVPLSEAFRKQDVFPAIYSTSLLAGEQSGNLPEVIDRYIQYQKLALDVRKKILVSLIYPCVLVTLVLALVVFLVTYVIPEFAGLYSSMDVQLPYMTQLLVAFGLSVSENLLQIMAMLLGIVVLLLVWAQSRHVRTRLDHFKLRIPLFGSIWVKHHVSQLCRLLSTLLTGGIPLLRALEVTGQSLGSGMLKEAIARSRRMVKEGQTLSQSISEAGIFPALAIEMIHIGESTGALAEMLNSVAEFFDDDVSTRMAAILALVEPAIMIFMGIFAAFVLVSLYLPILSLAERI